jgi:hypothetical protein
MKNPTIKQVEYVIEKLESVIEQACEEDAFDIGETRVYDNKKDKYECGTVHCVGGWYAVANLRRRAIKDKFNEGFIGFSDGAKLMAKDLGFAYRCDLENWAYENPEIWGNKKGYFMFDNLFSYDDEGFDGVIAQWQLVRDNLIELEK